MGAFVADVEFPIVSGEICAAWRTGLSSWSALTVTPKRQATLTKRVVTLRDDSGPQDGSLSRRRQGVNVFADSSVDAEQLALDTMREARRLAGVGPIKAVDSFTGPFEVEEDPDFTFGGKPMAHFYFAFRVSVKGSTP